MTKKKIAEMALDFHKNYYLKYHETKVKFYKYHGEIRQREDIVFTEEGEKISNILESHEIFTCPTCGGKKSALDLELWTGEGFDDLMNDMIECSWCYAQSMGDDI